ncbi:MAG: hypothetical protein ACJAT2_002165 [Bacteriovoracaceae bacterium]|jgi:hypothetical protein
MNDRTQRIEELVLGVLSFYEPMSFELILLDMPDEEILDIPDFNREDLEDCLKSLQKKKRIKKTTSGAEKEVFWIKAFPKKSLLQKALSFLKKFS